MNIILIFLRIDPAAKFDNVSLCIIDCIVYNPFWSGFFFQAIQSIKFIAERATLLSSGLCHTQNIAVVIKSVADGFIYIIFRIIVSKIAIEFVMRIRNHAVCFVLCRIEAFILVNIVGFHTVFRNMLFRLAVSIIFLGCNSDIARIKFSCLQTAPVCPRF